MFFILSKLLLIFILPFSWIAALLVIAFLNKKTNLKHRYFLIALLLLYIFSNSFFLNSFARLWDIKPVPLKKSDTYSCVIVLGGFSGEDASGNGFFNASADRFIQGLKLIATKKATHILISSGNGSLTPGSFTESDWVKTQLRLFNVPDSCILIENKSRNTVENTSYSKKVIVDNHLQPPYILVTSAFHMRRAIGIFKHEGLDVVPYPCNYVAGNACIAVDQFIPDAGTLALWSFYTKEVVGTAVNFLKWHTGL